ncbi:uncharacterized protein A4U43_C05F15620 [Asparagus officinalis]|uniref:Uncharacterized protein n=1 Tax=Asparagus officinalis TaxID=4686 RepID=A0A5P1ES30_ASPOF|nr:uncharacterized protein A4U43_C05F15620 [Asparagus officinalis]
MRRLRIHLHSFQNLGIQEVSSDKNLKIRTAAVSTLEISSEKNLKIRTAAVSTLEISSDKNLKIRTTAVSTLEIREVSNSCPQGAAEKERWRQLEAMRKLPVQWVTMVLRRWQNKKSDRGCDIGALSQSDGRWRYDSSGAESSTYAAAAMVLGHTDCPSCLMCCKDSTSNTRRSGIADEFSGGSVNGET